MHLSRACGDFATRIAATIITKAGGPEMSDTFIAKAPRGAIERVVIGLSLSGPRFGGGGGGIPEFTASDFAMSASGYGDPIGRHIVGAFLGDPKSTAGCIEELDVDGWMRWRRERRQTEISPVIHLRMASAAVEEMVRGTGWTIREIKARLNIGHSRWASLAGHYVSMMQILAHHQQRVGDHIARKLRA